MKQIEAGSYYSYLSEGCRICRKGSKLVFFITGECPHSCFYCPISEEKKGKDVIYANERPVNKPEDLIKELEAMDAEGVAITGGEPLLKVERLLEYLKIFRKLDLHVHIYTSIPDTSTILKISDLVDEIRFHPVLLKDVEKFFKPIAKAKESGIETGIEIPAVKFEPEIAEAVNNFDVFLNLNELEFSSTNYNELVRRGYRVGEFYGDVNSRYIAEEYARVVRKFHYCTSRFKDNTQFRRRLIRMAMNYPEFYQITEEGTLICGFIEGKKEKVREILERYGEDFIAVDNGYETSADFVENEGENLKAMGLKISIIERYPTWNRIVVEKIPL